MARTSPVLMVLLLLLCVACGGSSDDDETPAIGGKEATRAASPPPGTAQPLPTGTARQAGVWTGTIKGHLSTLVKADYGDATTDVDFEIDARLVENVRVLRVGSRVVGEYIELKAEGTRIRNKGMYYSTVDGNRCKGEKEIEPRNDVHSGVIVRKGADVDFGSLIGFDISQGTPVYQLLFSTEEVMSLDCTVTVDQDRVSIFSPIIGRLPRDPEGGLYDQETRTLGGDGRTMTGSYQGQELLGSTTTLDLTVEWNLTWTPK